MRSTSKQSYGKPTIFIGILMAGTIACGEDDESSNDGANSGKVGTVEVSNFKNTATKENLSEKTASVSTVLTETTSSFSSFATGASSLKARTVKELNDRGFGDPEVFGDLLHKADTFPCGEASEVINQVVASTTKYVKDGVTQATSPGSVGRELGTSGDLVEVTDNGSTDNAAVDYKIATKAEAQAKGLTLIGSIRAGANDTQVFAYTDIKATIDPNKGKEQEGEQEEGANPFSFALDSTQKSAFLADTTTKKIEMSMEQQATITISTKSINTTTQFNGVLQGGELPSISSNGTMNIKTAEVSGTMTFSSEAAVKDATTLGLSVAYNWDGESKATYTASFDIVRSDDGTCQISNKTVTGDITSLTKASSSLGSGGFSL